MSKKQKIITIGFFLGAFLIINLLTNFNYIFQLFYNDSEAVYSQSDFSITNNQYEITNINKKVKVIKIVFDAIPSAVNIEFTNDDFIKYHRMNSNYTREKIKKEYLYVYSSLDGKLNSLRITPYGGSIKSVAVNPQVPYQLNLNKTLFIFSLFLCLFYVFTNNNILNLEDWEQKSKCVIIILIITLIISNYYISNKGRGIYSFYNTKYTDSLINHRLDLDIEVDEKLIASPNPYDTSNRDFNYTLDVSYYKGKFYCYFGLLPNIVLFVPYKLITGNYMSNAFGCLVYSFLGVIATFLMYSEIIKKYFKNINFNTFILSFVYVIFGSKLLWCMHRPNFYELLTIAAYFHIMLGLYLVLFNNKENKVREFLGSTFLALAVLCRPTALLASFFIVPKIIDKFKKYKFKITKWLPLIIPYFVVGIIAMYINYVRFDNILEFGVSYQLAASNLNGTGSFSLLNGIVNGFYYLFSTYSMKINPISVSGSIQKFPILTDFHVEDIGGGVITTSFLGFIILFTPYLVKFIKDKRLKVYTILAYVLAFTLIYISSSSSSTIGRYMLDFNYLIYFVIIVISFQFIQKDKSKVLNTIYNFIIIISIIVNFLLSLSNTF